MKPADLKYRRDPQLTLKKLSAADIAGGKAGCKPVVAVRATATSAMKYADQPASPQDQKRLISDYTVEPADEGDKRNGSNSYPKADPLSTTTSVNSDFSGVITQPSEAGFPFPEVSKRLVLRPKRRASMKRRASIMGSDSTSGEEETTKQEPEQAVKYLKKEVKDLKRKIQNLESKCDEIADKYEDVCGGRSGLVNLLFNATVKVAKEAGVVPPEQTDKKRRRAVSKEQTESITLEALAECQRRLQAQQDKVAKCQYLCSVMQENTKGNISNEVVKEVLSDPKSQEWEVPVASPCPQFDEKKGIYIEKDSGSQEIGTKVSEDELPESVTLQSTNLLLEDKGTQTDQACKLETAGKPQSSGAKIDWETMKKNTTINEQPWLDEVSKLTLDITGGFKIIKKLPASTIWGCDEIILLQHTASLLRFIHSTRHIRLAPFQAIPIKMAIHLLRSKGMTNQEIATVFSEIDSSGFWKETRVSFIEITPINNRNLGDVCSLPQISQYQWHNIRLSGGTTSYELVSANASTSSRP